MLVDFTPIRPILRCFTDGDRCLPDGNRCLPDGSRGIQCCQPSKSCKNWWKYQKNAKKLVGNTVFAEELPDSSVLSVFIDVIGVIDWLSGTIGGIGVSPDILPATGSKVSISYPRTSASEKRGRIESYRHRLWSVTECPRFKFVFTHTAQFGDIIKLILPGKAKLWFCESNFCLLIFILLV